MFMERRVGIGSWNFAHARPKHANIDWRTSRIRVNDRVAEQKGSTKTEVEGASFTPTTSKSMTRPSGYLTVRVRTTL